jgi:lysophospholipase L1-like esterase
MVPALFFVLLEAGLRLGGYGVNTDLVLELEDDPDRTCYLNPDVGRRYFSPALRAIQPTPGFRTFTREKQPGALRVFVLGESTVAGFPFHVNGSFAGILEDDLRAAYPDRPIEVINCGLTAICSYSVLDFVQQLVRYDPDLFLICLGHNEFYGTLGAGSTSPAGATRGVTLLRVKLAQLRTYQLLSNAIFRARAGFSGDATPEGRSLMASMIRERRIRMEDPIHGLAEATFRSNLDAILEAAERHRVPVILSTVASNLRDLPPFDSAHSDAFDAAQAARVEEAIHAGGAESLAQAVALDTTYAAARYALARALDPDTTSARALREYVGARDHDVVHFRACTRFNAIIRAVAAAHHIPLVDMEAAFAAASPQGIPGRNLFFEHLHPNLHGAVLMAAAFRAKMRETGIIPASSREPRSFGEVLHDAALTPLDLDLARQRISAMTGQWPFQEAYGGLASGFAPAPANVARLAQQVLHKSITLDRAHEELGKAYLKSNDLERALPEFRALAKIYPVSPVGPMHAADILMRLHRPAEAVPYYRSGIALVPGEVEPQFRLALALHLSGDDAAAAAECRRIITKSPGHAGTRKLMREIATAAGGGPE